MRNKALANIEAARLLNKNSLYDSVASRAYYAAYHAAWHFLHKNGKMPKSTAPDGSRYWAHHSLPDVLCDKFKIIDSGQRIDWEILLSFRRIADYYPDSIDEQEARQAVEKAESFIKFFLHVER